MRTKVLIAEDEPFARQLLERKLASNGYEVISAESGFEAWEILQSEDSPELAILDWMMPDLDGPEICRRLRSRRGCRYVYVVLLTARGRLDDLVEGLRAGADDYLTKPYYWKELESRLLTGARILRLQSELTTKVTELENVLAYVRRLEGLLPICMHCKRIREGSDTWHPVETYIERHSNALFTHTLCGQCLTHHYPAYAEE